VVEATGRASRSPVQPGAGRHFIDRLICLSADLPKRAGAEAVAGIESCPDGWWYTAENTVGRTVSLFANADALTGLDDRAQYFADALKRTIHIGQLVDLPAPAPRPTTICARTSIRRMIWKRNWAASGDAAQTIDPLSGGGIGRAVEDALELAPAVSHALSGRGDDPLRSYALGRVQRFQEELAIRYNY
jgi:2-polyprenyl-6-methoxyphenol hydroxylase-like FAD-dependent oxidoreductase